MLGPDPHQLGLVPRRAELFALAEIGGKGNHLAAIGLLKPFQDHARVEAAGKGEHDAVDLVGHWVASFVSLVEGGALPPTSRPFKRHTAACH